MKRFHTPLSQLALKRISDCIIKNKVVFEGMLNGFKESCQILIDDFNIIVLIQTSVSYKRDFI